MSLYAIGDLHLSLGGSKPMDVFGGAWDGYVEKLKRGFEGITDDDTVVLCGDLSWGVSLAETADDFRFIDALPGSKIFLKGNHDYWHETAAKTRAFFASIGVRDIPLLNNNSFDYGGVKLCGTRGWVYDDGVDGGHNAKVSAREAQRLEASLRSAGDAEKICFFHYPPRFGSYVCEEIISLMVRYGVRRCFYGHIHGRGHANAFQGVSRGIEYAMVSADWLGFRPRKVL
ncbi:MAG: metallophosphoesterase [Oscillospiraceae bacterium]|jgi:predicted phosphohydrolase|nr:metallophosphoesterase [Oscillospiraceae bacterium]